MAVFASYEAPRGTVLAEVIEYDGGWAYIRYSSIRYAYPRQTRVAIGKLDFTPGAVEQAKQCEANRAANRANRASRA